MDTIELSSDKDNLPKVGETIKISGKDFLVIRETWVYSDLTMKNTILAVDKAQFVAESTKLPFGIDDPFTTLDELADAVYKFYNPYCIEELRGCKAELLAKIANYVPEQIMFGYPPFNLFNREVFDPPV